VTTGRLYLVPNLLGVVDPSAVLPARTQQVIQHETGAVAQEFAQIVEVLRGHERSPVNSRVSFPAISGNGRTAEHSPAFVT